MKYTMARYTVKPEAVKEVKRALAEFIAEVRKYEPKTLYVVFRESGQHTFVHWMAFENEAAERRHSQSRYNDLFVKKLIPNCTSKSTFTDFALIASTKTQWPLFANA
jgi:quinol monooxygenase YgiN